MLSVRPIERQLADLKTEQKRVASERRQQNAITKDIQRLATVAIISGAMEDSGYTPATGINQTEQERLQSLKTKTLESMSDEIQAGRKVSSDDIRNIGRFVSSVLPSGGLGASLDQNDIFGRGAISRFGGRTGGTNTVDTHEHFRVSRELQRLKLEALQVKLDTEARETEEYRQMRNRELIEHNVRIQTLPLAVGRK